MVEAETEAKAVKFQRSGPSLSPPHRGQVSKAPYLTVYFSPSWGLVSELFVDIWQWGRTERFCDLEGDSRGSAASELVLIESPHTALGQGHAWPSDLHRPRNPTPPTRGCCRHVPFPHGETKARSGCAIGPGPHSWRRQSGAPSLGGLATVSLLLKPERPLA